MRSYPVGLDGEKEKFDVNSYSLHGTLFAVRMQSLRTDSVNKQVAYCRCGITEPYNLI